MMRPSGNFGESCDAIIGVLILLTLAVLAVACADDRARLQGLTFTGHPTLFPGLLAITMGPVTLETVAASVNDVASELQTALHRFSATSR